MKKVISICLCIILCLSLTSCADIMKSDLSGKGSIAKTGSGNYETKLFDTSYVHTINITISEEDWTDLQKNPLNKTKYNVNITIDGETVEQVSFATKGNTSLSSIQN